MYMFYPIQLASPAMAVAISNRYDDQAAHPALSPATASPYVTEQQHQLQQQLHQHLHQHQQSSPQSALQPNERRYFEPLKGRSTSPTPLVVGAGTGEQTAHHHASKIPILQSTLLDQHQMRITIDRPHLRSSRVPSASLSGGGETASQRSATPQRSASPVYNALPVGHSNNAMAAAAASAPPPSDELRGQLPWSYFKSRSDTAGPKRTFTQLRDDEDLPPVPVPDYTLHFPRRDRPSTNSSDDGGE